MSDSNITESEDNKGAGAVPRDGAAPGSSPEDDTASGGAPEEPDTTDADGTPVENPSG